MTAEEFFAHPDERAAELIDGVIVPGTPTGALHGAALAHVITELGLWSDRQARGAVLTRCGYIIARNPDRVRHIDASFIRKDRLDETPDGFLEITPDLAVEVIAPDDSISDLDDRLDDYRRLGVPLVWVVNPATRTVVAHTPDNLARIHRSADVIRGGEVLPGFECPVTRFFP